MNSQAATSANPKDLTALYGVGKKRAVLLKELGIRQFEDLLWCDLEEVGWELSRFDKHVTMATLEGLRFHARSYLADQPLLFGPIPEIGSSYLIFDLEYEPFKLIWLIGVLLVEGGTVRHRYMWADNAQAERQNLESLARILRGRGNLPVVTWAGLMADLPQLRQAVKRLELGALFRGAFSGHVDLFDHCERSLRLPVPGLGLDAVSTFFGFDNDSDIKGGLEALELFGAYQKSDDPDSKAAIRSRLIDYNRNDLEALVATEKALQALAGRSTADETEAIQVALPGT